MSQDDARDSREHRDFFISYTSSDRQWAEWIAMQLDQAGYTLFIQAWDFRPGSNFVAEMDSAAKRAERTLLVLSPAYLESDFAFAEWATAFRSDPKGTGRRLLPVRIQPVEVNGLLGPVVFIDLVQLEEVEARERLLAGIQQDRVKPAAVAFPGHHESLPPVAFPGSLPTIWNVPFARNPFFTGRDDLLEQLHTQLQTTQAAALSQPQAISGLGGIGKTQLAIEYAYRYRQEYQAVLWARADTTEALNASYTEIAKMLQLPQQDAQEQEVIVQAVKNWLRSRGGWLLILDNADDLAIIQPFLLPMFAGHLLLTTRAQAMGTVARRLEIETMDQAAGALLLLRRARVVAPDASLDTASLSDIALARAITEELGGLPLALDQAGAYIEETACGLEAYQQIHKVERARLLARRGGMNLHHPEPVTTTWSLSFAKIEQANPIAAELLRICAFLAPDAIPEELLVEALKTPLPTSGTLKKQRERRGWFSRFTPQSSQQPKTTPSITNEGSVHEAVGILRTYSLLSRDPQTQMLTVHRLVQTVLRESLLPATQQHWMQRVVQAVNAIFPSEAFEEWSTCERLLSHVFVCYTWIEQVPLITHPAAELLNEAGLYLNARARYREAEPLLQRGLMLTEQVVGESHADTASSLQNLAGLYWDQGRYEEAGPLLKRGLMITEQTLGASHADTASSLNALAALYYSQGRYEEAEPLFQRALAIYEQQLGAMHPNTAQSLNNLANLYSNQGKYAQAEPLLQRALAIYEQQLGAMHPNTALSLNNLANLYSNQGKYAQAEPLLQRALAIYEQQLGAMHPDTARSLNNLAALYDNQGEYAQAEPLLQRALAIYKQQLGAMHPNTAMSLNNLAALYDKQGKYELAEPLFQQALAIYEQQLGAMHPDTARSLGNLAVLYSNQEKYEQAEPLFQRALAIYEQQLGAMHPDTARSLNNLAMLYSNQEKYAQAEPLLQRALAIYEQQLGVMHPTSQAIRANYTVLMELMKQQDEAE